MVERTAGYDVFLSYNWRDHGLVETVARSLQEQGLSVFLDRWYVVAGRPWPRVLEEALDACGAVAVFLGPYGMGNWQQREKDLALERQARDSGFPVIPVLLLGADPALGFLSLNTWIDLRAGLDDPLPISVLTAAIRGEAPGPDARERLSSTLASVCPYRGLQSFREEDAPFFFGREAFVTRMVEAVQRHNLVSLVGASGSGKSSVVRAGLVPTLRSGVRGGVWDAVTMVPGDRPLHSLAAVMVPLLEPDITEVERLAEVGKLAGYLAEGQVGLRDVVAQALAKQAGTDRLLLVVDQLEELYTQGRDDQANRRFLDELLEGSADGPLSVVLTLRGDFFGQALGYRPLADRLQDAVVNLGPMTADELEQVVAAPSQKVGLTFEPGLVDRILEDVEQEPGNLPLLEFLLTDLWEARRGGQLTHEAYQAMGGVQGAMAQRAEELFGRLAPDEQAQIRRVFTQLVLPGEDTQDTRRRATFNELGEHSQRLVSQLADARLLVTGLDEAAGEETVEVAHEALITNWSRLRGWLDEDREFLLWRQRLRVAVAEWERAGRDRGLLLRRAPLAESEEWLAQRAEDLNQTEQGFIRQSMTQRGRQHKLRLLGAVGAAVVALVVIGLMVVQRNIAVASRTEAETQRQAVLVRELAAQAQLASSPLLQVLLGIESLRRYSDLEGVSPLEGDQALRTGLALLARPVARMTHDSGVLSVDFSPDGKRLATGSWDNTARVWEAATGHEVTRMIHDNVVNDVDFSPDGKWLATGSFDGFARVWEAATGRELARVDHEDSVLIVAFNPDGRRVLSTALTPERGARVWEAATGREISQMEHVKGGGRAAFSPDGTLVASGGDSGTVIIWEPDTGREVSRVSHEAHVHHRAFSPDGRWLATAGFDATARVWETATGREVARMNHGGDVNTVAFSPDGNLLATASEDNTARVWEAATGRELVRINHGGVVTSVAFSPDGRLLATASHGKLARIWDAATGREVARMAHEASVTDLDFSPDGRWLATADEGNSARVWEASAGHPAVRMSHGDFVNALDFSADGRWLATGSFDNTARVWDTETGLEVARVTHDDDVADVALSPDGRWLATASFDNTAGLWEAATGRAVARMAHQKFVLKVDFSPDGTLLASASADKTVRVWETATGREVALMPHPSRALALAFSPDNRWLATGATRDDNTARVWEVATGELVSHMVHQGGVSRVAFSPDGKLLATAGDEGIPRTWDPTTGRELTIMSHQAWVNDLAFSPDGQLLATASFDKTAKVWEVTTGREVASVSHADQVTFVAFSPDGKWLATSGRDNLTRVSEAATGIEVARITHEDSVTDLAFSPGGKYLATSGADGATYLWLVWPEDLISEACSRIGRNFTAAEWQQYFGGQTYRLTCPNLPSPSQP